MTVSGERCVDLNNDALKIFGPHFSYNEKLKKEKIFKTNRYSMSFGNMKKEKPNTGTEISYF